MRRSIPDRLQSLIARARAEYEAMTPEHKAIHDAAQRESWARGMQPCEHGNYDFETCRKCRGWEDD